MATMISEEEFRLSGRSNRRSYPWSEWTNGCPWLITRGVDFDTTTATMRNAIYNRAVRDGLNVETTATDTEIRFRFRNPRVEQMRALAAVVTQTAVGVAEWRRGKRADGVERMARWLWDKTAHGVRRGELTRRASSQDRRYLDSALRLCLERGWLAETKDGLLHLGPHKPGDVIVGQVVQP